MVSHNPEEMEKTIAEMEIQKAWDLENEMKQILSQLKITDLSAKWGKLSGRTNQTCSFGKTYSQKPEQHTHTLLIMDEPTNHLDVEMVEWLEKFE